jgi:hypothetical protein
MWGPLVGGAVGGIATNEAQRRIDKNVHQDKSHEDMFSELHCKLENIASSLFSMTKHFERQAQPPIETIVTLFVDPVHFHLNTQGRIYNMIFVPNSTTLITANIPGLGLFNFAPGTGWTSLDFRSGTELWLTSGTQQNIIVRLTNTHLGGTLV